MHNRVYNKLTGGIPRKLFFGKDPPPISLGQEIYVKKIKECDKVKKFDSRAMRGFFLGYTDDDRYQLGSNRAVKVYSEGKILVCDFISALEPRSFYSEKGGSVKTKYLLIPVQDQEWVD